MKRSLTILFSILSLSIFFNIERGHVESFGEPMVEQTILNCGEQTISQGDNYIDLNGRSGSTSSLTTSKLVAKNISTKRSVLDILSGVKIAIANLYSESSYSYSCDFPFEHQPHRELYFILRNIRI